MEKESFFRRAGMVGAALLGSIGLSDRVNAETIPADFFATDNAKILQLANYDSVVKTDNWDDYYGNIKWNDGTKTNVPIGYRTWVLDANKKPCGLFDIANAGQYGFMHTYMDDSTTPTVDEGALAGDLMKVLVEKIDTGLMYNAQFVDSSYNPIIVNFHGDKGRYSEDILVNTTSIPEPSTLELIACAAIAGVGVGALKRRK